MGLGGIGPGSLILIAVIVLLLFGTKKLRNIGGDLGSAIKGFKKAMNDEKGLDSSQAEKTSDTLTDNTSAKSESSQKDTQKENRQA